MISQTTGTLIDGVVKLDEIVNLPNNSRVRVAIESLEGSQTRFKQGLKSWKQLCDELPIHAGRRRFKRDELHERG